MSQDASQVHASKSTPEAIQAGGVYFDPDKILLQASYADEISAYRARRSWASALELTFLLEENHDFKFRVESNSEQGLYILRCDFTTACARYAFWRLTNHQAPEAEHLIETGHLPITRKSKAELPADTYLLDTELNTTFFQSQSVTNRLGDFQKINAIAAKIMQLLKSLHQGQRPLDPKSGP